VNGFSTAISGVGSAIGRYFSIVSFIPSLFLTGFTFALIESGAWSGEPDWAKAGNAFTHIGDLAFLTLLSIALGVAVHPIQFALVQFFEGYWGTGGLAQRARVVRILHHRRRYKYLRDGPGPKAHMEVREADRDEKSLDVRTRIKDLSIAGESRRLLRGYPAEMVPKYPYENDDILPTRLGNVMRRYERLAGSQYGLDAITVIRQIALVAPPERLGYLNDQRQLLDLSVRMSATSIVATLISIIFLWRHGPWLLIALVPYGLAYLSYRGAITVAHEHGAAYSTMIDLDRFALYDYLRIRRPMSTKEERRMNAQLMRLLSNDPYVFVPYEYPDAPDGTDKGPEGT
jgi:hypothetical protein